MAHKRLKDKAGTNFKHHQSYSQTRPEKPGPTFNSVTMSIAFTLQNQRYTIAVTVWN